MTTSARSKRRWTEDSPFDEQPGYESDAGIRFAEGLTLIERKRATIICNLFNGLWGMILVKGQPGCGKDVFANYLQYKLKQWFPWKRILRDEKPRRLFGEYDGLFNERVIVNDLAKMRNIAKGLKITEVDGAMEEVADNWVKDAGDVLLQNSVLYLTEYAERYCPCREPHRPMNKTMGAIQKMKRHLDLLIIATTQLVSELDKKTALPWIDWRVTCSRSTVNLTGFTFFVEKVAYDRRMELLIPLRAGHPFPISFDAGKPRSEIGDGKIVIKKPQYEPENEEERVVLSVLKSGIDNYEKLVEYLETEGDMTEWETLSTLKVLGLKLPRQKPKFVIGYPCYFGLYNSKSVPQLKTAVKVGD